MFLHKNIDCGIVLLPQHADN
jgi:hypothetical protein